MTEQAQEKIELLSVSLLDQHRQLVTELKELARSLGLELGWHYLLDLAWILSQLGPIVGKRIMDAGAGTGLMQWYLASRGAVVISVDRSSRAELPLRFRSRFQVKGLRQQDLIPSSQVVRKNLDKPAKIFSQVRDLAKMASGWRFGGQVIIYNHELKDLPDILDGSLDAVVAVSSLEHNLPQDLPGVVSELMRKVKPGGKLLATLCACGDQNWLHVPSSGWCYTDSSLRQLFNLPSDLPSNYNQYDQLFTELCDCAELRDNLAKFYFKSDQNGMPWGKWDPQYLPVGISKRRS
jgi:SAM-dependent methyltransferase